MIFHLIGMTSEQAANYMPRWLAIKAEKKNTCIFAAEEDSRILALAMYSVSKDHKNEMIFDYLFVAEERRGQGIGTDIIAHAENEFRSRGIRSIICRCIGDAVTVRDYMKFLANKKFIPLTLNAHFMMYYVQDFPDTKFGSFATNQRELAASICKKENVSHVDFVYFLKNMTGRGNAIGFDSVDSEYGNFYVSDDRIAGFMDTEKASEKTFLMNGIYADTSPRGYEIYKSLITAFPLMFDNEEVDSTIFMQIYDDREYKIFLTLFGKPEIDFMLQEYFKRL
ncbi:MAG: GNAT family N-acetyltransferase [Clostridia bacterium]|nr:GNAT family N-acetyltransferase [Clostridia bacterium]